MWTQTENQTRTSSSRVKQETEQNRIRPVYHTEYKNRMRPGCRDWNLKQHLPVCNEIRVLRTYMKVVWAARPFKQCAPGLRLKAHLYNAVSRSTYLAGQRHHGTTTSICLAHNTILVY